MVEPYTRVDSMGCVMSDSGSGGCSDNDRRNSRVSNIHSNRIHTAGSIAMYI